MASYRAPTATFRPLIKHAKLTLHLPRFLQVKIDEDGAILVDEDRVTCQGMEAIRWLEPLLTLRSLGFALEELEVEVEYAKEPAIMFVEDDEEVMEIMEETDELKRWIEKDVRGCTPDACTVRVIYKEI